MMRYMPPTSASDVPAATPRWIWWLNGVGLVIGLVGLVVLWRSIGTTEITSRLGAAGPAFAVVVGLDLILQGLRARVLQETARGHATYLRAYAAQVAGNAVADVTPTGALGEATKVSMLARQAPAQVAISAVVCFDLISLFASTIVVLGGIAFVAASRDISADVGKLLAFSAVALLAGVVAALTLGRRWFRQIRELRARDAAIGIPLQVAARGLVWLQYFLFLEALGVHVGPTLFVLLMLAQGPVGRLATVVPLGLGLTDVGFAGVFVLLGLPPEGGAGLAMLWRLRMIASGAIGLTAMGADQLRCRRQASSAA